MMLNLKEWKAGFPRPAAACVARVQIGYHFLDPDTVKTLEIIYDLSEYLPASRRVQLSDVGRNLHAVFPGQGHGVLHVPAGGGRMVLGRSPMIRTTGSSAGRTIGRL